MAGRYYTIKGLKRGEVWHNDFGEFQGYSLSLEGLGEPVSMNKKVPVAQEPAPGDKLYGTVEMLMNKAGKTYYKFKAEKEPDDTYTAPSPQNPSQTSYEGHSDKEDSIARAVALKGAVEMLAAHGDANSDVLGLAEVFLSWLKNESSGTQQATVPTTTPETSNAVPSTPAATTGYQKFQEARNKVKQDPELQSLIDFADEYNGGEDDNTN